MQWKLKLFFFCLFDFAFIHKPISIIIQFQFTSCVHIDKKIISVCRFTRQYHYQCYVCTRWWQDYHNIHGQNYQVLWSQN